MVVEILAALVLLWIVLRVLAFFCVFGHAWTACHIVMAPGHKFYPLGQGSYHSRCARCGKDEGAE